MNINKNALFIGLAVLAILVTGVLIYANSSGNPALAFLQLNTLSKDAVAKKAIDYLNTNVLEGQTAELGVVSVESGVIKMEVKIGGTSYDSYATKDGKLGALLER